MTAGEMVKGCMENEPLAQAELYAMYSAKMLAVCYRYAAAKQDAEDILQEAFIKVFTQIHTFESKGSLEGWIRRIIVNTCINYLKKNKKINEWVELDLASSVEVKEASITSLIQNQQVIDCIKMLPTGYRTVLNLYAIEGFSHKEIAAMLDIEEGTSRSQYSKAKHLLENILIQHGIAERMVGNNQIILI